MGELLEKINVSKTSDVYRFSLPNKEKALNLSTCACILAKANINDEVVVRPYTPISTNDLVGCFDLLVKNYGTNAKMSNYMHGMSIGDKIAFKHIPFNVKIQAPFEPKNIIMLVGGTGITPMIQALHAMLGDTASVQTNIKMIYGSRESEDILGKDMVDLWAKDYSDKFSVLHVLSHEPAESSWTGLRGFINKELLLKELPPPSVGNDVLIFVCGPPIMYDILCGPRTEKEVKGLLADMGYNSVQVYKF